MAHTRMAINAAFVPELGMTRSSRRIAGDSPLQLCSRYTAVVAALWPPLCKRMSTSPRRPPHPASRSPLAGRTSGVLQRPGCTLCTPLATLGPEPHARAASAGRYICRAGSTSRDRLVGRSVREGSEENGGSRLPPQVDWLHGASDPVEYDYDAVLVLGGGSGAQSRIKDARNFRKK